MASEQKRGFYHALKKPSYIGKREYKIRVTAAIIDSEDGKERAYYPSANEELVEDA